MFKGKYAIAFFSDPRLGSGMLLERAVGGKEEGNEKELEDWERRTHFDVSRGAASYPRTRPAGNPI